VPTPLHEIIAECDRVLSAQRFEDYGPNGLQFPGRENVETIVSGVSAHVELFQRAIEQNADLILVHHGIFWGSTSVVLDAALKRRLAPLFAADVSLAAYHLPLDAHPKLGNNAQLAALLGGDDGGPFGQHRTTAIGRRAIYRGAGIQATELFARIERVMGRAPLAFQAGPPLVRELAIVSGAGADFLGEAIAAGCDAFLTGEPAERVMAQAQEAGIHFFAAGHHATETFGVRRLGEHLAETFNLRHVFVDIPNPI
jgi:dinuclear metal center YbgI/SA1388 family protein